MHYIYILISMVCLGVTNFLFKYSSSSLGPSRSTYYYYLFGLLFSGIAFAFTKQPKAYHFRELLIPASIAFFLFISLLTFNIALKSIPVSKAATIRNLSFIMTLILALALSREKLLLKDYFAIILATGAICLLGWSGD